jgi:hypothetical protein
VSARARVGAWLRKWADRIDDDHAPRRSGISFTFEEGRGIVTNQEARGCPLWYLSSADYERAHDEAETEHVVVMWRNIHDGREPKTRRAGGRR